MVIKKVKIEGYGCLKNISLDLGSGLNMIYGLNGSGKSTFKNCILALFFGQKPGEKDEMRPWEDIPYKAAITYSLRDGKTYTVERDFEAETVTVIDANNQKDITKHFIPDEKGNPDFVYDHLGMNRERFLSAVKIDKTQMIRLEDTSDLKSLIVNLADSANDENTYQKASDRLRSAINEINLLQKTIEEERRKLDEEKKIREKAEEIARQQTITEEVDENMDEIDKLHKELDTAHAQMEKIDRRREKKMEEYRNLREKLGEKTKLLEVKNEILELVNFGGKTDNKEKLIQSKQKMLEGAQKKEKLAKENYETEHKIFANYKNAEAYDKKVMEMEVKAGQKDLLKKKTQDVENFDSTLAKIKTAIFQRFLVAILMAVSGGAVVFYGISPGILQGQFEMDIIPNYIIGGLVMIVLGIILWLTTYGLHKKSDRMQKEKKETESEIKKLKDEIAAAQITLKEMFTQVGALSADELRRRYRDFIRARIDLETSTNLVKVLQREIDTLSQDFQDSADLQEYLRELKYIAAGESVTSEAVKRFKKEYTDALTLKKNVEIMRADYEKTIDEKRSAEEKISALEKEIKRLEFEEEERLRKEKEAKEARAKERAKSKEAREQTLKEIEEIEAKVEEPKAEEEAVEEEGLFTSRKKAREPLRLSMEDIIGGAEEQAADQTEEEPSITAINRKKITDPLRMSMEDLFGDKQEPAQETTVETETPAEEKKAEPLRVTMEELLGEKTGTSSEEIIVEETVTAEPPAEEKKTEPLRVTMEELLGEKEPAEEEPQIIIQEPQPIPSQPPSEPQAISIEEMLNRETQETETKSEAEPAREITGPEEIQPREESKQATVVESLQKDVQVLDIDPEKLSEVTNIDAETLGESPKKRRPMMISPAVLMEDDEETDSDAFDFDIQKFARELQPEGDTIIDEALLKRHKKAIQLAIEIMLNTGDQFRKQVVAPQISYATTNLLNKITDSYEEFVIDENLNIKIKAPGKEDYIATDRLSGGSIYHLYFVMRLAMAQFLFKGRENMPMILEDPFLLFDDNRRHRAFDVLIGIEQAHQVIFFTCSSQQKLDFARGLKRHHKIARLIHAGEMELIKPAEVPIPKLAITAGGKTQDLVAPANK